MLVRLGRLLKRRFPLELLFARRADLKVHLGLSLAAKIADLTLIRWITSESSRLSLIYRYGLRSKRQDSQVGQDQKPLQVIALQEIQVFYINLAHRLDRLTKVKKEFERVGLRNHQRIEAVRKSPGILGCTLSHAKALQQVSAEKSLVLVCEDDVEFIVPREHLLRVIEEFAGNSSLDVLCLSYNLGSRQYQISESLSITCDTQTASCYLVKPAAQDLLRAIFLLGARRLERGWPARLAANDIMWKRLQRTQLIFAIPNERCARQSKSFSDIENKVVDYNL